ncbi:MAG: hypothetical protein Q8L48_11985 [Archangium sp.]|nr:hypothetical protein [Archangium sp.]
MIATFRPEDRQLLDRGWPHQRVITDEPAKTPGATAAMQYEKSDSVQVLHFPRAVAHAYLWAQLHPRLSPEAKAAARRTEPFDEVNVPALLDRLFPSMEQYAFHCEDALYLLEALFGAERTAGWIIDRLERTTWRGAGNPHDRIFVALTCLGFILLRVEDLAPLHARLRKVRADLRDGSCHGRYLDVILDREQGWARIEPKHLEGECCFIGSRMPALTRDGAVVNALNEQKRLSPWTDPQFAWLAGLEMLPPAIEARGWTPDQKQLLVEGFGLFSEPKILRPVLLFAVTAMPRPRLRKWLADRADVVRVELAELAKSTDSKTRKKAADLRSLFQ